MAEKEQTAYQRLTKKQRDFVDALMEADDGNATAAATIAGYAVPKQEGWRLRQIPDVRAAIDERSESAAMSGAEVLAKLTKLANDENHHIQVKALGVLARYTLTERHEHSGPNGGPIVIQEVIVEMPPVDDDDSSGEEPS